MSGGVPPISNEMVDAFSDAYYNAPGDFNWGQSIRAGLAAALSVSGEAGPQRVTPEMPEPAAGYHAVYWFGSGRSFWSVPMTGGWARITELSHDHIVYVIPAPIGGSDA